MKLELLN